MKRYVICSWLVLLFVICRPFPCSSQPALKMGALVPFTGRWAEAGREYAQGMSDAVTSLNERGGIQGRRLEIVLAQDTFQPGELVAAFRKFNEFDEILLLNVYAAATAQTLIRHIQSSRIPTLVSSLPSDLTDASKYPCLFSTIPTPLDLAKIALTFISERAGIKAKRPKLTFVGSSDYIDQQFVEEAKAYASSLGLDVQRDVTFTDLSLSERMAKQVGSIVGTLQRANCDFAYLSASSKEASSIIDEARKSGLKTTWVCNSTAFNERLTPYEGVFGVQPISFFGERVPGMAAIEEAHRMRHPDDRHTLSYVEGWATVRVAGEALRRSLPEKRLSRERTRMSLESFKGLISGGLIPPLTISSDDHRPSMESRVLVIKDGKITIQSTFISVPRGKKTIQSKAKE